MKGLKGILILFAVWLVLLGVFFVNYRTSSHKSEESSVSLAIMSKEEAVSRYVGGVIRLPEVDVAAQYGADVLIPDNEPEIQTQLIVAYSKILAQHWQVNSLNVTGGEIQQLGGKRYWVYTIYPVTRKSPTKPNLHTASSVLAPADTGGARQETREINLFNLSGFFIRSICEYKRLPRLVSTPMARNDN